MPYRPPTSNITIKRDMKNDPLKLSDAAEYGGQELSNRSLDDMLGARGSKMLVTAFSRVPVLCVASLFSAMNKTPGAGLKYLPIWHCRRLPESVWSLLDDLCFLGGR